MNHKMVAYVVGWVLELEAILLLLPALIGLGYGESSAIWFFLVAVIAAVAGLLLLRLKPENTAIFAREGFVATALSWIVLSLVGALPMCLSGQIPNYIDAVFEMVSGFTTTGASIVPDVGALHHSVNFWRCFSHWLGGMGVLVFMMAVLPLLGGQNLHLMKAESPGPSVGKLVPRIRQSAIWLYGIYAGLTVVCFLLLWIGGMDLFSAVCISLGTAGTGGFAIVPSGFNDYSLYSKWVVTVFMMLCGTNFNLFYFLILKKVKDAFRMEEVIWYYVVYFFAVVTILLNLSRAGMLFADAMPVDAFFSVASVMTTTGYGTVDFNLWPTYSRFMLVLIMFCGACAGSTGGGIKISRFIIFVKSIGRELRRVTQPRSVKHIRIDGKRVDDAVIQNTEIYLIVYVLIFVVSMGILTLDGLDLTTTFTAVTATLNNIGPGLNLVGPYGNFDCFSYLSKIILSLDMLFGRLELFPMLILFAPSTWKKQH